MAKASNASALILGGALALAGPLALWLLLQVDYVVGAVVSVGTLIFLVGLYYLVRLRLAGLALFGLCFFHFSSLLRYTWFFGDMYWTKHLRSVAGIGMLVLFFGAPFQRLTRKSRGTGLPLLFAYWVWLGVSGLLSRNPSNSVFYVVWLLLVVLAIFATYYRVGHPERFWVAWLFLLVISGTALTAGSLLVSVGGLPQAVILRGLMIGYRGLMSNPNSCGLLACLTIGGTLALHAIRPDMLPGWMRYSIIGVCSVMALLALSRSAMLGLIIAAAIQPISEQAKRRRGWFGWLRLGIPILFAFALVTSGLAESSIERLLGTQERASGGQEGRVYIWVEYGRAFLNHPVFGVGFMQVAFVEGDVASRFSGGHARSPHSTVLVYGLAAGIPGLLLFFEVLRMAFRNLRCHPRSDIRRSVVLSVAPVLPGMTANTFADPGMWGPFAFWVPLLFCLLLPAWDGQPPNESEWGQLTSEARSMRQREGPRLVPATALSRPG